MEVVTGAIGSLLPKLGELLKEEYKLQKGAKKDVQSLTREVASMQAALGKVGQTPREQLDEQVKLWAGEVRELSYVMEDTIDTFLVRVEGSEPEVNSDGSAFGALMKKMAKLFDKGKTRHQIADAIKDIKDRVQEVAQRRSNYKIDDIVASPPSSTTIDPRLSALYNKITDLVGIDEPREELIKRLAEGGDAIKVVSLAGFGGLGKTTLAKAVYESLRAQFDCAAFVSVSQNPDITRVFKKMLHQLDHKKYAHINEASWDETQLIDELREFLRTKRDGGFDLGLGNLLSLGQLSLRIHRDGVTVAEAKEMEAVQRHALDVHPNRPSTTFRMEPTIPGDLSDH
nr:disease resistance protein Pik-2-like [Aegilops tauschii subsp. strangulata]